MSRIFWSLVFLLMNLLLRKQEPFTMILSVENERWLSTVSERKFKCNQSKLKVKSVRKDRLTFLKCAHRCMPSIFSVTVLKFLKRCLRNYCHWLKWIIRHTDHLNSRMNASILLYRSDSVVAKKEWSIVWNYLADL